MAFQWAMRSAVAAAVPVPAQANLDRMRHDPLLSELSHDLAVTRSILLMSFVIGLGTVVAMWIFGVIQNGFTAFFWALACFATGSLLGFLFGIPKVFQRDAGAGPRRAPAGTEMTAVESDPDKALRSGYQLVVNTNLDDISDWLTKIAVGVGLVELEKMPHLLYRLAGVIAEGVGAPAGRPGLVPFVMALLLYFTTAGFMSGYLTTRMFFQRAFRIADLHATGSEHRSINIHTVQDKDEKITT